MNEDIFISGQHSCHLILSDLQPKVVVVKPLGPFEWKCLMDECTLLSQQVSVPFAMVAFDMENLDSFRQPDAATLAFLTGELVPELRRRFGSVPLVLGGYSLGGLFALWSSTCTPIFDAVAACSPSLWADWWGGYAEEHPSLSRYVYLSVGDTEEKTRKMPFALMGDSLRAQHERHQQQLAPGSFTLEWNEGGHFADIEMRKAKGFAWCINKIFQ